MEINEKLIGKRIRERRKYRFGTQEEMADKMHITRSTISAWENGNLSSCTLNRLVQMCNWFECDLGYLMGEYSTPRRIRSEISEETGLRDFAVQELTVNYTKLKNELAENPYDFDKYGFDYDKWSRNGYLLLTKLFFIDTLLTNVVKWEEMARYSYEFYKYMELYEEDPLYSLEGTEERVNYKDLAFLKKEQAIEAFLEFTKRIYKYSNKTDLEQIHLTDGEV